jgi:hypothetical protein
MKTGDWRPLSVIYIAQTPDGDVLIDGQHRMAAVIAADVTVEFIVCWGVKLDDQQVIDTGRGRNLGDTLGMRGESNVTTLAAAIGWHWRRERGRQTSNLAPTIAEGLRLLQSDPGLRESVSPTRAACRNLRIPAGLGCCLHYEMSSLDSASADEFWATLATGLELHERHPIYVLRTRLEKNASSTITKLDKSLIHALIIKAWNSYLRGDEITFLRWSRGGANAEPFPELEGPDRG